MTPYSLRQWVRNLFRRPARRAERSIFTLVALEDRITPTYSVAQLRSAYGINSIPNFNSTSGPVTADGTGQTIAIVDAYDDKSLLTDLDLFDKNMTLTPGGSQTLYQLYGAASTFVTVYNQAGVNITSDIGDPGDASPDVPKLDPTGKWENQEALDIEWAHAIAPGSTIYVVLCDAPSDLFTGDSLAASLPGVSVVSDSWGGQEQSGETSEDSVFETPAGHTGVTFVAASGDLGALYAGTTPGNAYSYPAVSPNVVAVGGTDLTMSGNNYASESAWSFPTPSITQGWSDVYWGGDWTTQSGGFGGSYGAASGGGNENQASWLIYIPSSDLGTNGGVEISLTWPVLAGNATHAVVEIYDEYGGSESQPYTLNEAVAPVGITDDGYQFQEVADFFPQVDSGQAKIEVRLEDGSAPNGTLIANGVGVAPDTASTGGISEFEQEPSYQDGVQSTNQRTTPDVSFFADPTPGVNIYEGGSELTTGGTSLATPAWAGLIAIADQGRVTEGAQVFDSPSNPQQTQQILYSLPSTDFNSITTGYNGFAATAGYNMATGLGSPIANLLVPDMVDYGLTPTVTNLSLTTGPASGGQSETITGTNFTNVTAVDFGSTPASNYTVVSSTEITATVPAHVGGTVDVTVTTLISTSKTSAADHYTYIPLPVVTAVSPNSGSMFGGETVTIAGTGFTNASAVDFGSDAATSFTVVSDTEITAVDPSEPAGIVDVTVTTPGGTSSKSSSDKFSEIPVPIVSGVSPDGGPLAGGTTITISGVDLTGASAVDFGTTPATSYNVVSDTEVTAVAPAESPGTVDVTVTTGYGTSGASSADQFSYVTAPAVTGVSPDTGSTGGDQTVTITGTSLATAIAVDFGSVAGTITSDTNTQIVATTPVESAGTVDVTVVTSGGTSPTSDEDQYTYTVPPQVSGVSPNAGPLVGGQTITITGSGLSNATAVEFGSVAASSFAVLGDTEISAVDPVEAAGTVDVTVTTAAGTSGTSAADQFTYAPVPVVLGVAPDIGSAFGGVTITLTGTGFTSATAVDFGTVAATSFAVVSATEITAVDPAEGGSTNLTVDVTVTTAGGTSGTSAADQYTFVPGPTVTGLSVTSGPLVGGGTLTITGTNLANASAVDFGTTAATMTSDSATQVVVTVPAESAGTVDVTVTTQNGGSSGTSSADQYTYIPVPAVTGLNPSEGPTAGGAMVTITGTALAGASSVRFGTTPANIVSSTAIQVVVTAPAGLVGQTNITVTTPGGTSPTSGADLYTYAPAPNIQYISITQGSTAGGATVTLTGSNLGNASAVDFGSASATIVSDNGLQIVVTTPVEAAGTVPVTATTAGGTATAPSEFTFVAVPAITGLNPPAGPIAGNTPVTISGSGFTGASTVKFGNAAATSFTVVSDTEVTAVAPAEAAGTVDVTVTVPVGGTSPLTSADRFIFEPVPVVTSVSPSSGSLAGGTSVTITGSNLANAIAVDFGASAGTILSDTATLLVAASPGGTAGTADVTVVTGGGTSATTSADKFTTNKAVPTFTGLSSPTISYGTASAIITGTLSANAGSYTVPADETVQVTLNGMTQTTSLMSGDTFSTTFATGALTATNSPYALSFSYAGDSNYSSASSTNATLTVTPAVATFTGLSSPTITYGTATVAVSGTLAAAGGVFIPAGEMVQFSLNGITQSAKVGAAGTFSTTLSTTAIGVVGSPYTIGFVYAGDGNFAAASGSSSLTVTQATPVFGGVNAPIITPGTASTTISGTLGAGSLPVPANETVEITLNGTTEDATVGAGGSFGATFDTTVLDSTGSPYPVSLRYAGDADFVAANSSTSVTVVSVDAAVSTVSASASSVASGSGITVTVHAMDAAGNPFTSGGLTVAFGLGSGAGQGTFSSVTDNGNGTYSATFTGTIAGANTITATINEQTVGTPASVSVTPGAAEPAASSTTLSASTVAAGTNVTVTVTMRDAAGNQLTTGGLPVQLTLGSPFGGGGAFGPVTDHGNGTYTASFSGDIAGANTIIALIDGAAVPAAAIAVTPGQVSLSNSTLMLSAQVVQLGGSATVTLAAVDAFGNPETTGGLKVAFAVAGTGTLGPVVDHGDGTYTATLTGTGDGDPSVSATIGGNPLIGSSPSLAVIGSAVSPAKSKLTLLNSTLSAGGTTTVTLQAANAKGQPETAGGLDVTFELAGAKGSPGTFITAVDNQDGTYTATIQCTLAGSDTITAAIAGANGSPKSATVKVTAGTWDPATSRVTVSATTVKAGGKVTVTLQPEDAYGNKVTAKGLTVQFGAATLTLTGKYQSSGTYTASFPATKAGTYPIAATIDGETVTSPLPTVTVVPGAASAATSTLSFSPSSTVAVGGAIAITLQAMDAYGNDLTTGGLKVTFALGKGTGKGTFGPVSYIGNGQYTVMFTGTVAGTTTLAAAIAGAKLKAMPTVTVG